MLEPLFAVHRSFHPKADLKLLQKAYEVAEVAHSGQFRRSGDLYITHPLAVASILADLLEARRKRGAPVSHPTPSAGTDLQKHTELSKGRNDD